METPPDVRAALRELYPALTDKELEQAELNLRRYFDIALDIITAIDKECPRPTMEERSKELLKI